MSSLYKDAIADARKLREAAEQNAKNRIIEAVTPKLRSLIERQIAEGDDGLVDDIDSELLDAPDAMDMLDAEEDYVPPPAEIMDINPEPMSIDSDGLGSIEVIADEEDEPSVEDESQNKSVHVNITVEGKRNYLLRHRAVRLVKALSEAKTRSERNKIRKELRVLREALIITENSQNVRLAKNIKVILKESTMRRRKNSWLFEGEDTPEESVEEVEFDDADLDEEGGETMEVDIGKLEDAFNMEPGTLAAAAGDGEDEEDDLDDLDMDDDEDMEDEDMDFGDETYESMGESDGADDETLEEGDADECDEDDEVVEVNEAMLRRALGASRRRRTAPRRQNRRLSESARRRRARINRRRRLREGEAKAMASSFGGGKAGKEMFVDVDENTLLNALAEELGNPSNATAAQGRASKMASHFGGGSVKKGAVMESRRVRSANRKAVLAERKARAAKKELKESNLFNAKLLYVTKLMQQHTLNNKQQRAIIEAMDNAKTQREAKLLFSSLNESLNKRTASKQVAKGNKLNENRSRTGTTSGSLRSGQAPNNNGVELDRWAVLAGLRK
jgi:hypothetical protein